MNSARLPDVDRYITTMPRELGLTVKTRPRHAYKLGLRVGEPLQGLDKLGVSPGSVNCAMSLAIMWCSTAGVAMAHPRLGSVANRSAVTRGSRGGEAVERRGRDEGGGGAGVRGDRGASTRRRGKNVVAGGEGRGNGRVFAGRGAGCGGRGGKGRRGHRRASAGNGCKVMVTRRGGERGVGRGRERGRGERGKEWPELLGGEGPGQPKGDQAALSRW